MTVLDGIRSNADGAHASLEEARSVTLQALEEAGQLEQSAAAHGWGAVAEAMSGAQQTLEATLSAIDAAAQAAASGVTGLGQITDTMSSDEVAERLGAVGEELGGARSSAAQAAEALDDAEHAAHQADAATIAQMVATAKEAVLAGIGGLDAATADVAGERSEATAWGN